MRYAVRCFKVLASTNGSALELARKGAPEGLVVRAEHQTKGRGRAGRKWFSRPGENLLFSIVTRPPIEASRAPLLTQVTAQAIKTSLERLYPGFPWNIKRPNDILTRGRKICGILVESSSKRGRLEYAVIGIGLNVNSRISGDIETATSIYEENGRKCSKNRLFRAILEEFKLQYLKNFRHRPTEVPETVI